MVVVRQGGEPFLAESDDDLFSSLYTTYESDGNPESEDELYGERFGDTTVSDGNATTEGVVFTHPPGRAQATWDPIPPAVGAVGSAALAARSAPVKLEPPAAAAPRGLTNQRGSLGAMRGAKSGEQLQSVKQCSFQSLSTRSSASMAAMWSQQSSASVDTPRPCDAGVAADIMPCRIIMGGSGGDTSLDGDDGGPAALKGGVLTGTVLPTSLWRADVRG